MKPDQCTAAESPLRTQRTAVRPVQTAETVCKQADVKSLTQQDLQSVGVQVQSLRLLLHHVHLLCLLVVVTVDAGVGQHLQTAEQGAFNT